MRFSIRAARPSDREAVAAFTATTFDWGDYVADAFTGWLDDPLGRVMVAVDADDRAFGVGRCLLLSADEAWLQGARVREDARRQGVASEVGEELVDWAARQGAQVARLVVEGWNTAAQRQVEKTGFRAVGSWIMAERTLQAELLPTPTNGGRRAKARRKLSVAHSSEAQPAWISWESGPLLGPARGLFARDWRWARLELSHLEAAARSGALWQSPAGWADIRLTADQLSVGWLDCAPDDATDMVRSIIDLAADSGADAARITVPNVDWLTAALRSAGCEHHEMVVYARAL